jgi:hypothetical protein
MGAKQFSDTLNVMYCHRHEHLEVQYMETVTERVKNGSKTEFPPFPNFEDWCHQPPSALDQHMSQLSTCGLALDHSHKVTKHIAKVLGEAIFCGLLSMTNDFGELRVCDLVPTNIALERMRESIETFGLEPPKVIFTDNMADKQMLEAHFPSLKTGVQPVASSEHPPLSIPEDVTVNVCTTPFQMTAAIGGLMDQLGHAPSSTLTVGLDTEWNVDQAARQDRIPDVR